MSKGIFVEASNPNDTQRFHPRGMMQPLYIYYTRECMRKIRASVPLGFTFFCTRVSGETVPRHDLSHPARTKKQIDASSHYNSLPPLPSLHRAMLYPPGIARQIKHHLLSERVDLDLTAPSTPGECVDDQDDFFVHKGRTVCEHLRRVPLLRQRRRTRDDSRERKFCKGSQGSWIYASVRDSVCTSNITHNREDRLKNQRWIYAHIYSRIRNSNDIL